MTHALKANALLAHRRNVFGSAILTDDWATVAFRLQIENPPEHPAIIRMDS